MKIAVLVSGGVDSSVALHMLHKQGHELVAFYLKIWLEEGTSFLGTCPWEEDLEYVRRTCDLVGIPLQVLSLQKEYHSTVVAYTLSEIKSGRTPNPDIFCNAWIKFGLFFDQIDRTFDNVATGHYAQVVEGIHGKQLWCSPDEVKDQTYFLAYLKQLQLQRALFPIGHLTKRQVRDYASIHDLPSKVRKDSQGICFLGSLKYNDFISHYTGQLAGPLIEFETGKILGTHHGYWYHTIGQRRGLRLAGGPWYVVAKNHESNAVYISRTYYNDDKKRDTLTISSCNWIDFEPRPGNFQVKLRHGKQVHNCYIEPLDTHNILIKLCDNDQGIASGQFAVLYDQNRCLGAGVITGSHLTKLCNVIQ